MIEQRAQKQKQNQDIERSKTAERIDWPIG